MDTSNIPYIDDESSDSRNNSARNSRCIEIDTRTQIIPNYVVEKHVIYNQKQIEENENLNIRGQITGLMGVKEFIQGFGRTINIENLNTKPFEAKKEIQLSIQREEESDYETEDPSIRIKRPELEINSPDIKGGVTGFFDNKENSKSKKIKTQKLNSKESKNESEKKDKTKDKEGIVC